MLSDDFIDSLEHLIGFWANLIVNIPSWKHILGVFFVSLLFTSTSLPKFFNALKVIMEIIYEQKGLLALLLTAPVLVPMAALLLPINLALQLSLPLSWIALKASFQLIKNSVQLLAASINLLLLPLNSKSFFEVAFSLFESSVNLSVRLGLNICLDLMDAFIFILTNHSLLSSLQNSINTALDNIFEYLRPTPRMTASQPVDENTTSMIPVGNDQPEEAREPHQQATFGFFANTNLPLHNQQDIWLVNLLAKLAEQEHLQEQTPNTMAA